LGEAELEDGLWDGSAEMLAELFTVKKEYSVEGVVVLLDEDREEERWGGVTRTVKSGVSRSGCVGQVPGIKFCW
jgi:hypothetical protein